MSDFTDETFTVSHGTFTVEHWLAAAPARVFRAWSVPEQMAAWAAPADDWTFEIESFDFRLGGVAVCRFGPRGDVPYHDVSRYDDIVQDRRIVNAYTISKGDIRLSSSVSTLEFVAQNGGTLLRITEVGAFLDGQDSATSREGGVRQQIAQLGRYLSQA